ncbi:MAG TPA: PKD domain-containing protein, partial [Ohtaekwangia sp.]|uniref:PKD domain-containing protein n=1 Tax=Ohtaekwangia sp. TaxID=2066019 RepID=UPI002F936F3A
MKLFYTMVFFVGLLANTIWSFGQTSPCSITRSGPGCINQPITFYSSCPDNYTHFLWYIDGTQVSTSQSYTHTFTSGGTHTVKLGASCSDGNCSSPNKPVYTQTTVYIESVPQPSITASTTQLCETGTVTLSVDSDYNNSGYDFLWRSVPAGFTGSGTSVTFNNVATTTTFYLKTSGEACSNESQITVNVSKTSLQPALGSSSFYHRQTLTASGGIRSGHYWEQSSTGKDVNNPVNGDYIVYESGDYYTRYYSAATNCWASPLGPVHVGINYTPPQAAVGQILKSGYNEVYFTNDEKNYIFSYADYYWVSGAGDNPSILRPYSVNGVVTGNKLYKDGVYYLKGKDRGTGTWGPTTTLSVSLRGDQGLNWVQSKIFDGTISAGGQNTDKSIAESKTYFDGRGNQLQAQVKSFASGKVLVTQQLRDRYDRVIGSTLPAPTASSEFAYNAGFVLNEDGDIYSYKNFDLANSNDPDPVSGTEEGTLGWFYSANNTLEPNVAKTKFPYSRTELYEDGTGEIRRVADVGEVLKLGSGNEIWNATYPVRNELNDYIQKRNIVLPGISTATSLAQLSVQQISRDQNKKFTIAWSDRSGKTIMSARFGTPGNYVLQVTNAISCSISGVGAAKSGIFYLTNQQKVELDARYDA